MSEIKINEDNCVLSKYEMDVIESSLEYIAKKQLTKGTHEALDVIYKKILKLNEMVRGWRNKKLVLVTQEFIDGVKNEED